MTTPETETTDRVHQAALVYISRRDHQASPAGSFDKSRRWYPAESEYRSCCDAVREPSRAWPFSYLRHCRTANHVAQLHGVSVSELRRAVREIDPLARTGEKARERDYYKAVAVLDNGELVSIYDGKTAYVFGQMMSNPARQHHQGGYYVYDSARAALQADVPLDSKLLRQRRAVIRVRCEGRYCRYGKKLAFSRITPVDFITYPYDPMNHTAEIGNILIDCRPDLMSF